MILDPVATGIGGGGVVTVVWLFLKYKPWLNGGSRNGHKKAGDLDPSDWEQRLTRIVNEIVADKLRVSIGEHEEEVRSMLRETVADIFSGRNEQIRAMLREELQHFYGLTGSRRWKEE